MEKQNEQMKNHLGNIETELEKVLAHNEMKWKEQMKRALDQKTQEIVVLTQKFLEKSKQLSESNDQKL